MVASVTYSAKQPTPGGSGGSFFPNSQQAPQFNSGVLAPSASDIETIRITVPAGTNKIFSLEGAIASVVASVEGVGLQRYLVRAVRANNGLLEQVNSVVTATVPAGVAAVQLQDAIIDGNDIVVRVFVANIFNASANVSGAWVMTPSAIPIPEDT